ncbi:MAG TPA: hypothetical protein VHE60_13490 [Pyrinomonadaceae bacterium]|nr:hypothetical protein [Pyrinomonadaceae bacterium]
MKTFWKALLLGCASILLGAASCLAQEPASQNSDLIRQKIEELEKIDLQSKSTTVQDIYRKSLLRLYQQYSSALQQDIADLKKLQSTIGATSPETQKEISAQLQKLGVEQNVTTEKMKTLGGNPEVSISSETNGAGADGVAQDPKPTKVASAMPTLSVAPLTKPISNSGNGSAGTPPATSTTITLCGQIKPASLIQILALVESSPELVKTQGLMELGSPDTSKFLNSTFAEDCTHPNPKNPALRVGSQKEAVTVLLRQLLDDLATLSKDGRTKLEQHGPGFSSVSRDTIKKEGSRVANSI